MGRHTNKAKKRKGELRPSAPMPKAKAAWDEAEVGYQDWCRLGSVRDSGVKDEAAKT